MKDSRCRTGVALVGFVLTLALAFGQQPGGQRRGQPERPGQAPRRGAFMMAPLMLGDAGRLEPALVAVFGLTEEQRKKIQGIVQAVMEKPPLSELREKMRAPNLTEEQRRNLGVQMQEAVSKVRQEVLPQIDKVLTPAQKQLREKLEAAAKEVLAQVKLPKERGPAYMEVWKKAQAAFAKKLGTLLTPEQQKTLEEARQRRARGGGPGGPGPRQPR